VWYEDEVTSYKQKAKGENKMKIQQNKIKTATIILGAVIIGLMLLSPMTVLPSVNAQSQLPSGSCSSISKKEIHDKATSLDNSKAKLMAENSNNFKTKIQGHGYRFNSIFNTWSLDKTSCNLTWKTTNIVYSFNDTKGSMKNIVVTEDPALTKIISVTEQVVSRASTSTNSYNWAGYEPYAMSSPTTKYPVYEATTTFTLPSITYPSNPTNACKTNLGYQPCDLAIWDGIEDSLGGSNNLAQAGADEDITYNGGYQYSYYLWYEFLTTSPGGLTQCTGLTINPSDSITSDVYGENTYGGSNTSYDISITDNTSNPVQLCTVTGQSFFTTSTPYYGTFIDERLCNTNANPCPTSSMSTLPSFTSDTFSSTTMYYNGGTQSIDSSFGVNGWYNEDKMNLNGSNPPNISNGAESSSSFTETYRNSLGT
jgi:hypothetical protein